MKIEAIVEENHRPGIPTILFFTKEEEEELYQYSKQKDLEDAILEAIRR